MTDCSHHRSWKSLWSRASLALLLLLFAPEAIAQNTHNKTLYQILLDRSLELSAEEEESYSIAFNHALMAYMIDSLQPATLVGLAEYYGLMGNHEEETRLLSSAFEHSQHDRFIGKLLLASSMQTEKWEAAKNICLALLEKNPTDPEVILQLTNIYTAQKDLKQALQTLDKLYNTDVPELLIGQKKAELYLFLGQDKEAEKLLTDYLNKHPEEAHAKAALAFLYTSTARPQKAKKLLRELISQNPQENSFRELLVQTLLSDNDFSSALKEIEDLANLPNADPEEIQAMTTALLQSASASEEINQKAIPLLQTLQKRFPQDSYYFSLALANTYFVIKDTVQGEKILIDLIENGAEGKLENKTQNNANELFPYLYFIEKYEKSEEHEKLEEISRKGISQFPDNGILNLVAAFSAFSKGNKKQARDILDQAIKRVPKEDPSYGDLLRTRADLSQEENDFQTARKYYEEALLHFPDPSTYNNYAYALATHGSPQDLNKAEDLASKAIKLKPNDANALDTYAWILYLKGAYDLARIYIESAISHSEQPTHTLFVHYAEILEKLELYKEAQDAWEKAIQVASSPSEKASAEKRLKAITSKHTPQIHP